MVALTSLSRNYWYGSTVNLALDTVSVVVIQYNDTVLTTTNTIYGNVGTVSASTITEVQSLASFLEQEGEGGVGVNYGGTSIVFGNATEGKIDGSVTIPYPTPYLAIDGFEYVSITAQVDGCPPAQVTMSNNTCSCIIDELLFGLVVQGVPEGFGPEIDAYPLPSAVIVSVTSTYYEALSVDVLNLSDEQRLFAAMDSATGTLNTIAFSNFLSAASVFESYPALRSCAIYSEFNGPPAVMIPASALTATVTTTVAGNGRYSPSTPTPASPIKATTVPQTAEAPSPTPTVPAAQEPKPAPSVISPSPSGTPADAPEPPDTPEIPFPESPGAANDSPDLPEVQTTAGPSVTVLQQNPGPIPGTRTQMLASFKPAEETSAQNQAAPNPVQLAPVLTVDGSTYLADQASHFVIAGQTVAPGGEITVSGTPIAIDTDASIAMIGSSTQLLSHIVATSKPLLTFAGTTYTANDVANFVIAGETLTRGGTLKVDGTLLSFDQAGTGVVVGTSTQLFISPGIITAAEPVITFGGSTYTAGLSSNFILDGQTLTKGGIITVDGTQLSYDKAGTAVVIGTSTQPLSLATITAAAKPILTFDGSTYVADSSSNFVVDGQTLSKGSVITVDGTRLSYDPVGTDVVIGTSTQMLGTTSIAVAQDPAITFDGSTYYANPSSDFIIDGQTLTRGGVITIQGTPISYAAAGTDVVVGTSTEAVGLGGYIMSGFGGSSSASGVAVQFTGEAARKSPAPWILCLISGLLAAFVGLS